jgi:hypothetical protein
MRCEPEARGVPEVPLADRLCTANTPLLGMNATSMCQLLHSHYGHPGGLICRHCSSLADCPGGPKRPNDWTACKPEGMPLAGATSVMHRHMQGTGSAHKLMAAMPYACPDLEPE